MLSSCGCVNWIVATITLVGLAYLYCTWTFSHWKKRGIPFVKPFPLLGNLKDSTLMKKAIGEVFVDIYSGLKGHKYGGFFKFRQPSLMICDPELIKAILVKDFSSFHDNDINITIDTDPMFGRNPFCLRGERWRTVRSQLTPALTPGKLKPLVPLINDVCKDATEFLNQNVSVSLEAKEFSEKFTADVLATCTFGLNGQSFKDPDAEFRKMGKLLMKVSFWQNVKSTCVFLIPSLAKFFKISLFNEAVANFFRKVVQDLMQYRKEKQVTRRDFLQLLIELKAKGTVDETAPHNPQHERFTDEDVTAQSITFFVDGFETSSICIGFTLFELARNLDIQSRLRAEVDSTLVKHGEMSYTVLHEMTYLDMVLAESLRKYTPGSFVTRLCTKPYDLPTPDGGVFKVEVGTPVTIPIWGLHMDPQYYPDPERFDPERFTEEKKAARPRCTYLPFGDGPRMCLGTRFAITQIKTALVSIVSNFEIRVSKETSIPLKFDPNSFLLIVKGGIWLTFSKRKQE